MGRLLATPTHERGLHRRPESGRCQRPSAASRSAEWVERVLRKAVGTPPAATSARLDCTRGPVGAVSAGCRPCGGVWFAWPGSWWVPSLGCGRRLPRRCCRAPFRASAWQWPIAHVARVSHKSPGSEACRLGTHEGAPGAVPSAGTSRTAARTANRPALSATGSITLRALHRHAVNARTLPFRSCGTSQRPAAPRWPAHRRSPVVHSTERGRLRLCQPVAQRGDPGGSALHKPEGTCGRRSGPE